MELHTSFAALSLQSVVCRRCKSPGVCGDPKEDYVGVTHVIFCPVIAVHVVCRRCKSPGVFCCRCKSPRVCGDPKEDHVGVAHVICRLIIAVCVVCRRCTGANRQVWRPERASCSSCTRNLPPYHCSVCCVPQVRRCKSPGACGDLKEDPVGVALAICNLTVVVCVVYHRYKSPGVCGDQKEDRVGDAHVICRSINAEFCLPQVQVARCVLRP